MHQVGKHRFQRRSYYVDSYWNLLQMDLGFMPSYDKKSIFLLAIDVFSLKIYGRILQSKKADDILEAIKSIFDGANMKPNTIETGA